MPHDNFVGVHRAEPVHLDKLLLGEAQQSCQQVRVDLEYLDELHQAAVGYVELAVQPEGLARHLEPVALELRSVHAADQQDASVGLEVADVVADPDRLLLSEHDPDHRDGGDLPPVQSADHVPASRAEVALDVYSVVLL